MHHSLPISSAVGCCYHVLLLRGVPNDFSQCSFSLSAFSQSFLPVPQGVSLSPWFCPSPALDWCCFLLNANFTKWGPASVFSKSYASWLPGWGFPALHPPGSQPLLYNCDCSWKGVSCSFPYSSRLLLSIGVGSQPIPLERGCFLLLLLHQQLIFAFFLKLRQFPTLLPETGGFCFYFCPESIDICLYGRKGNTPSSEAYCFCFKIARLGKWVGLVTIPKQQSPPEHLHHQGYSLWSSALA